MASNAVACETAPVVGCCPACVVGLGLKTYHNANAATTSIAINTAPTVSDMCIFLTYVWVVVVVLAAVVVVVEADVVVVVVDAGMVVVVELEVDMVVVLADVEDVVADDVVVVVVIPQKAGNLWQNFSQVSLSGF